MSSLPAVNVDNFVTNNMLGEEKEKAQASLNEINSNEFQVLVIEPSVVYLPGKGGGTDVIADESIGKGLFASIPKRRVAIEPKQTEDPPKQFKIEYIWEFFRKFWFVLVCFGLIRNISVYFGCFDIGSKHRNKPKFFLFGFTKQT
jgi:hypothetical protein